MGLWGGDEGMGMGRVGGVGKWGGDRGAGIGGGRAGMRRGGLHMWSVWRLWHRYGWCCLWRRNEL